MTQLTAQSPSPTPPDSDGERHRGAWIWPTIVIGLLSFQVVICLIAYFVATADPSQVVVSNYHRKALAWDEHMAELRAGEALGWEAELVVAEGADMLGDRVVRLSLKDAEGDPLIGAAVTVNAFHYSRAKDIVKADLNEAAPGEYVGQMKVRKNGRWGFGFVASRGEDVYRFTLEAQVGPAVWRP
jgi:nitrogen fixation protein FixH